MRIVVALGGNALLRRGQPLTSEAQAQNVAEAAVALAIIIALSRLRGDITLDQVSELKG